MAYSHPGSLSPAYAPRLGWRARRRAARDARLGSERVRRRTAEAIEAAVARAVEPDGVRQARALLIDGSGPLYAPQEPGELRRAARRAVQALDGERVAD